MEANQCASGIFRSLWGCSTPAWDQSTRVAVEEQRWTQIAEVYQLRTALMRRRSSRRGTGSLPISSPREPSSPPQVFYRTVREQQGAPFHTLGSALTSSRSLCSPFVSKLLCLHAAWRCKPQGIHQWRGDICSGPRFHLQPPCRIHYRMVMAPWPNISTNQAHFQQGFYIMSNAQVFPANYMRPYLIKTDLWSGWITILVRRYFLSWWFTLALYNLHVTLWPAAIFLLETKPKVFIQ